MVPNRRGRQGTDESRNEQRDDAPDLLLDIPVLNVDEIELEVDDLRAHVSLNAEVANFVKINVGIDAYLDNVKLGIKGIEAQALLKVKLQKTLDTLNRALEVIGKNPQILGDVARHASRAVGDASRGVSQSAREAEQDVDRTSRLTEASAGQVGEATKQADDTVGWVTDEAEQTAGGLLDEVTDEAGRTVRRVVDESGDITEITLNESGEVLDEEVTANVAELQFEEEHVDEQGRIVERALDGSGNVVERLLDQEGNLLGLKAPEKTEHRKAEDTGEVKATDAAKREARKLGVRLSEVKGTGSGGRILVGDVEKAARA